jgi:metal-responsive CopG/Arc/MetJ family transcriptional regulator
MRAVVTQTVAMSERLEKTISARMPVQLVQAIDKRAAARRLKRADIVREILWQEVERQNDQATRAPMTAPIAMEGAQ